MFDFQTQKWFELAKGSFGFPSWSKDGQYLQLLDFTGKMSVIRIHLRDAAIERLGDLKDVSEAGHWGTLAGHCSRRFPLLLRVAGSQDIYALDWEEP